MRIQFGSGISIGVDSVSTGGRCRGNQVNILNLLGSRILRLLGARG